MLAWWDLKVPLAPRGPRVPRATPDRLGRKGLRAILDRPVSRGLPESRDRPDLVVKMDWMASTDSTGLMALTAR
jgi:hypothetical protein